MPKNDFTRKIIYFDTFTKMPKNEGDLGKLILKTCPKSNKSPNLVTLSLTHRDFVRSWVRILIVWSCLLNCPRYPRGRKKFFWVNFIPIKKSFSKKVTNFRQKNCRTNDGANVWRTLPNVSVNLLSTFMMGNVLPLPQSSN